MLRRLIISTRSPRLFSTRASEVDWNEVGQNLRNLAQSTTNTIQEAQQAVRSTLLSTMMRRMSSSEAMAMAEHWGYIDSKKKEPVASAQVHSAALEAGIDKSVAAVEPAAPQSLYDAFLQQQDTFTSPKHLLHSELGELVLDLQGKSLYKTSVQNLSRSIVWEKQRILRPKRSRAIADEKIRSSSTSGITMPGVITMYHDRNSGATGIIDGQHRAAALILLVQEGYWDPLVRNVMVEVFHTSSEGEIRDLFCEINSAEPVRLIDMPTHDPASAKMKAAIDETVELLEAQYPSMWGSPRCRAPHLNADKFRNYLFENFMTQNNVRTSKQLQAALKKVNNQLMKKQRELGASSAALKKASKHGFFLAWLKEAECV